MCATNSIACAHRICSRNVVAHPERSEGSFDYALTVSGLAGPSPPWRRLPSPTDSPPGCPLHGSVLRMTGMVFRHPERSAAESKDP